MEDLHAIGQQLSPKKRATAESAISRMTSDVLAQWLAELSSLSVEQAMQVIRTMIDQPGAAPDKRRRAG